MITCHKCGTILPEGSKFCQKCGTRLIQQSDSSDLKNSQPKGNTESTSKDFVTPKSTESKVKMEKKESSEPLKPKNENVSSGQSVNSPKVAINHDINESEKKVVHSREPLETEKSMNVTDENAPVSNDKPKISNVQKENEPSPMVKVKSDISSPQSLNKDVSPKNLSPIGKRLYDLKMLNEHKIINDEEYNLKRKKILDEYINS